MNQRGFVIPPLGIGIYGAIAAAVVILGLGVSLKVQTSRLASCKQEFATFQSQVKALGEVAAAKAKAQEAADIAKKEKIDNENQALRANNAALVRKLRLAANSRKRELPAAPAASRRPDLICLDRAEYQRENGAINQRLFEGIRRLADEGTASTIDLDSAKSWAASTKPTP